MTAPGDSSGQHNDTAQPAPSNQTQAAEQPVSDAPWVAPSSSPAAEYPPPPVDYPPTQEAPLPGYPPDYQPSPAPGYSPNPAPGYPPNPAPGYPPNLAAGYPPPTPPSGYTPPPYGAAAPGYGNPPPFSPPPPPMPGPYGSPPAGYYPGPDYYGGGYGSMQTGTNTMAIIALVCGIVGVFCCVGSIAGIACGTVAINQIKQTREDGFGLAVAGIVISAATLLVYFIAVMFSLGSH
ncbi:MAG: DUF4190 domain-containing protein [Mycobacterium sp.]|nr:MAG: DUF4190 domain-containing protein [Mycobacterium sp.]